MDLHKGQALTEAYANSLDEADPLGRFRDEFLFPRVEPHTEKDAQALYFCGNSLGLLPKRTKQYYAEELEKWSLAGVEGHFTGARPWARVDEPVTPLAAQVLGAKNSEEVVIMNSLSTNLHLMLTSFYRPTKERFKILMEGEAFCSDHHVVKSQVQLKGLDPADAIIGLMPREGESSLRTEDILKTIEEQGDSIALVMFGGVQFYTGQCFEMSKITEAGHAKGCVVGFDLAHAVGNVELKLHDWGVDFACFCTYKYLNAGPGSIGGAFVHERHHGKGFDEVPRMAGWWGQDAKVRFQMKDTHQPFHSAQAWQLSNPPVFPTVALQASLELHCEATMPRLRAKSVKLTGFLEALLEEAFPSACEDSKKVRFRILTPRDTAQRGAQLSLFSSCPIRAIGDHMAKAGVICDVREPNVMRVSPAPMYNSYADVWHFVQRLKDAAKSIEEAGFEPIF